MFKSREDVFKFYNLERTGKPGCFVRLKNGSLRPAASEDVATLFGIYDSLEFTLSSHMEMKNTSIQYTFTVSKEFDVFYEVA